MRRIIIILFLFFTFSSLFGQTSKNFKWYNTRTYELYLAQDWDNLITIGKEAINAEIDFYYLRMRLGIAYYNKGEYRNAIPEFTKALNFYEDAPLSVEYLYYSYKFSGRTQDANLLYGKHKLLLDARNVNNGFGFITGLYSEAGLKFISPSNQSVGALKYVHIGAFQQLGSRLSLYQGYMRISRNFSDVEPSKYAQNEYYLKATMPISTGLQLMGSFHTQAVSSTNKYTNFAFMAGLVANTNLIDFSLNYGRAQFNFTTQQQVALGAIVYPTPNQNIYLQSILTYHIDGSLSNEKGNLIFFQKIGVKLAQRTWFDVYGSFGDMKNAQDMDGFYQYNLIDHLVMRLGATGTYYIGNRTKLLLGYTFESLEVIDTNFPYKQHYMFAGLQISLKK